MLTFLAHIELLLIRVNIILLAVNKFLVSPTVNQVKMQLLETITVSYVRFFYQLHFIQKT
jgi:hypothetical protein